MLAIQMIGKHNRKTLQAQYERYAKQHDRAPHIFSVPGAEDEAGYWLGFPNPLHAFDRDTSTEARSKGHYMHVREIILDVLTGEKP